jgi:hypothetical protein
MTAPPLAAWLVEKAFDLPESEAKQCCGYGDYEVDTQVALRGGGRPDLQFRFAGGHRPPGKLYGENKIRAGWTTWQRLGYPAVPASDRIVVLHRRRTLPSDVPPEERHKFIPLSWTDLAREVDRIGRVWGGLDWSTDALRPEAPGQYRVLAEFLWYLEREDVDVSVPRPITERDLALLPNVNETVVRWKQLRDLVLEQLWNRQRPAPDDLEKKWEKRWYPEDRPGATKKEELAYSATFRYGPGWEGSGWPALSRLTAPSPPKWSWQELILSPQAPWMNQDAPFVAIGVGFERLPDWSDDADDWNRLRETISEAGAWIGFTNREKIYRVLIAKSLAEIAPHGETLDAQAERAVTWALAALDELLALEPAP